MSRRAWLGIGLLLLLGCAGGELNATAETQGAEIVVLLHAVEDDPRWELPADALDPLLERLVDLDDATPVPRPALGYRGVRIRFHGGAGPGPNVEVFAGTVLVQQRDGSAVTLADTGGLEAWLRDRARERGIDVPE